MTFVPSRRARLVALERNLAESVPFGCYKHISENLSLVYVQLLNLIANEVPSARRLLDDLIKLNNEERTRCVFRDSLTRRAIEDSVCRVVRGVGSIEPPMIEELLSGVAKYSLSSSATFLNETVRCKPLHDELTYGY